MEIDVEGILFTPITPEIVSFDIVVGEAFAQPTNTNLKKKAAVV